MTSKGRQHTDIENICASNTNENTIPNIRSCYPALVPRSVSIKRTCSPKTIKNLPNKNSAPSSHNITSASIDTFSLIVTRLRCKIGFRGGKWTRQWPRSCHGVPPLARRQMCLPMSMAHAKCHAHFRCSTGLCAANRIDQPLFVVPLWIRLRSRLDNFRKMSRIFCQRNGDVERL